MTERNYEFVHEDTIEIDGYTLTKLTRIRATKDIPQHGVKAGDLGGYIETIKNLIGNAWVADNAWVFGNACVYGNAWVGDNARVSGHARVSDNTGVSGNARVYDNARVFGNACVSGDASIEKSIDLINIGPAKSSGRYTNAFKDSKIGVRVVTGCFSGSLDEFNAAIEETHKNSPEFLKQYRCFAATIEASF